MGCGGGGGLPITMKRLDKHEPPGGPNADDESVRHRINRLRGVLGVGAQDMSLNIRA